MYLLNTENNLPNVSTDRSLINEIFACGEILFLFTSYKMQSA